MTSRGQLSVAPCGGSLLRNPQYVAQSHGGSAGFIGYDTTLCFLLFYNCMLSSHLQELFWIYNLSLKAVRSSSCSSFCTFEAEVKSRDYLKESWVTIRQNKMCTISCVFKCYVSCFSCYNRGKWSVSKLPWHATPITVGFTDRKSSAAILPSGWWPGVFSQLQREDVHSKNLPLTAANDWLN